MRTRSAGVAPGGLLSLPTQTTRKTRTLQKKAPPKKLWIQFEQEFPLEAEVATSSILEEEVTTKKSEACKNCPLCGSLVPKSVLPLTPVPASKRSREEAMITTDERTPKRLHRALQPSRSAPPKTKFAQPIVAVKVEEAKQPHMQQILPAMHSTSTALVLQHATPRQQNTTATPNTSWFSLSKWITNPLRSMIASPSKGTSIENETEPTAANKLSIASANAPATDNIPVIEDIPVLPLPAYNKLSASPFKSADGYDPHRSIFSNKESSYAPPRAKTQAEVQAQLEKEAEEIQHRVRAEMAGTPTPKNSKQATYNLPEEATSGQKRKLAAVDGMLPGPKTGGFGIDDSYLDLENEIENFDESAFDTPVAKKAKMNTSTAETPKQPPRSAMRTRGNASITRSAKNVKFNRQPLTSSRPVQPTYGRSGQYTGSIFADAPQAFSPSPSSIVSTPETVRSDADSVNAFVQNATSRVNTISNTTGIVNLDSIDDSPRNVIDLALRDPQDPSWRPQAHNPRPGQFCLPDDLSDYDDDEDSVMEKQTTPFVDESPPTPRMAHAELPNTPPPPALSSHHESILSEIGSSALNKIRATAEKYKPEAVGRHGSSKLSQVTQARSRSSSPSQYDGRDNDGMTAPGKEHQFDDWAAALDWPEPGQHITETEVFNSPMMQRVCAEWTADDSAQSERFWDIQQNAVIANGRRGLLQFY